MRTEKPSSPGQSDKRAAEAHGRFTFLRPDVPSRSDLVDNCSDQERQPFQRNRSLSSRTSASSALRSPLRARSGGSHMPGTRVDMGAVAVVRVRGTTIVPTSLRVQPFELDLSALPRPRSVGLSDPGGEVSGRLARLLRRRRDGRHPHPHSRHPLATPGPPALQAPAPAGLSNRPGNHMEPARLSASSSPAKAPPPVRLEPRATVDHVLRHAIASRDRASRIQALLPGARGASLFPICQRSPAPRLRTSGARGRN